MKKVHIFISYKRGVEPDEPLALAVFQALNQQHEVFIDQKSMGVGVRWAQRIEAELRQTDFLVVFLSESSVQSEMVKGEIEIAYDLAKEQDGCPTILPVRVAYQAPFPYPLNSYLNGINWTIWQGLKDTPRLIEELQQAISGSELSLNTEASKAEFLEPQKPEALPPPPYSAQPQSLEMPEGTMDPESNFYVERPSDAIALNTIEQEGVTITIKGPRQMGKSSLLLRIIDSAAKAGKQVAFLDFQLFDKPDLTNADRFFPQFCHLLTDELELEDRVEEFWQQPLSNSQRCNRYMGRYLLKELGSSSLVLAMDEVESIFDTDFRSDFFGMLRSWHNNRARKPIWKQLDLALVTSTEPYQLIDNLNQSPFNVGQVLELNDFTAEQVVDLNQRHGNPFRPQEEKKIMALIGGHPYLARRALYLVASQRLTIDQLFAQAKDERGPFGDHLRYHLFRLYDKKELVQGLLQVIRSQTCPDERIFFRLRGAGLVRREGKQVVPRCQLYAEYFKAHLRG